MTCPNVAINHKHNIWYCISQAEKSCFLEYQIIQQTDDEDNSSILLKRTKRTALGCITLLMLMPYIRQFCCRQIQFLFAIW